MMATRPTGGATAASASRTEYVSPLLQHPINRLFVPRVTPEYLLPTDRDDEERTWVRVRPTSQYVHLLEAPSSTLSPSSSTTMAKTATSPKLTRAQRIQNRKIENRATIESKLAEWNPSTQANLTEVPRRTIFVGRLPYDITEARLRKEFERYGTVKQVYLVRDTQTQRPRGYAFVEYERERDVQAAFHDADGLKIDGQRRIVVDIERGRTQRGWRPRRLGGGLGRTRLGGKESNQKFSGRDPRSIDQLDVSMRETLGVGTGRKRSPSPPHYDRDRDRDRRHHRSGRDGSRDYSHHHHDYRR